MKELSIEEKAKAYDEAKLRMSAAYNSNRCTIGFMNEIFPELKESEDERIKKVIADIVKAQPSDSLFNGTKEKCLAWLEKQGEHKKFRDSIQVGDRVTRNKDGVLANLSQLNRVAKKVEKQGKNNMGISEATKQKLENNLNKALEKETPESCNGFLDEQNPTDKVEPKFKVIYAGSEYNVLEVRDIAGVTFYGIEDEPNHIDYVLPNNCEIVSEPKPTEWSAEDEKILNLIIARLHSHPNVEAEEYGKDYHWLKSLKDRIQLK